MNCSNLIKICSIPNICDSTSLLNSTVIIYEKNCEIKRKLLIINTSSDILVTIVNSPSSLKEIHEFNLHDDICIPDKNKSLFLPQFFLCYLRSTKNIIVKL